MSTGCVVFSIVVSTDGIMWMGLRDDNLLYAATCSSITLWSVNQMAHWWSMVRSRVLSLGLAHGLGKSTRILAVAEDGR